MKTITFYCPACNQKIETPARMAGQPLQCPTCNQGFVAPKRKGIHDRPVLIGIIILAAVYCLLMAKFSSKSEITKHDSPTSITGLFGIKLDEPLPQDCQIISSNVVRGVLQLKIIPTKTNATFEEYSVSLDKQSNVIEISGSHIVDQSDDDYVTKSYQTFSAFSDTLRTTLGNPYSSEHGNENFDDTWEGGDRETWLRLHDYYMLNLTCSNKKAQSELYESWRQQQHDSVDTSGIGAGK
jgi:hypothetical protein